MMGDEYISLTQATGTSVVITSEDVIFSIGGKEVVKITADSGGDEKAIVEGLAKFIKGMSP